MKNLQLKAFWKTYNLELEKSKYLNNDRIFLWLIDANDWEYFSDITINVDSIETLPDECLINPDFEFCFKTTEEMRKRLEKNLKITSRWIHNGYHTFTL